MAKCKLSGRAVSTKAKQRATTVSRPCCSPTSAKGCPAARLACPLAVLGSEPDQCQAALVSFNCSCGDGNSGPASNDAIP